MTGKDIVVVLSQGGTAVASAYIRTQDIQTEGEQEERASATQQTWREYLAGRCGWSLTVGYLVLAASQIADLLLVNQTFDVTLKDKDNTCSLVGKAIMRSVKHTATVGNLAQGSFSLLGTGPLAVPVTPSET